MPLNPKWVSGKRCHMLPLDAETAVRIDLISRLPPAHRAVLEKFVTLLEGLGEEVETPNPGYLTVRETKIIYWFRSLSPEEQAFALPGMKALYGDID